MRILAACPNEVYNTVLDAESEEALRRREQEWAKEGPPQERRIRHE